MPLQIKVFEGPTLSELEKRLNEFLLQYRPTEIKIITMSVNDNNMTYVIILYQI